MLPHLGLGTICSSPSPTASARSCGSGSTALSIVSWVDPPLALNGSALLDCCRQSRDVGQGCDFGEDEVAFIHAPEFEQLFKLYTANSDSVGSHLTQTRRNALARRTRSSWPPAPTSPCSREAADLDEASGTKPKALAIPGGD